jgi:hypothetical protein
MSMVMPTSTSAVAATTTAAMSMSMGGGTGCKLSVRVPYPQFLSFPRILQFSLMEVIAKSTPKESLICQVNRTATGQ